MKLIESLDALPAEVLGGAFAIGNFDGVHLGHAQIVSQLVAVARRLGGAAAAFTFEPHPARLLRPDRAPSTLTTLARKAELLGELGVDTVVVCPTNRKLLQLSPREFFDQILVERLGARAVVEGPNFLFGHDRAGNIATLRQLCQGARITLEIVPPVELAGQVVSSSRVRKLLQCGAVDEANELLTQPYRIVGTVRAGAGRGAQIGFPTANLHEIATLVPGVGVYAGAAWLDERLLPAAIHIGPNPTFGEEAFKVEVHLPGWNGPLYDQVLAVDIVGRLRDIHPFPSVAVLVEQLRRDVAEVCDRFERALPKIQIRSHHGA